MKGRAYAKVNLILEITGKRSDGYHEIDTVMSNISLYDEMSLEITDGDIKVECDHEGVPSDETNLAYRAAAYMFEKYGIQKGADITIKKNIPYGAGLGGGSSDAAWVINALNSELALGLSAEELEKDAAALGADVAFFIKGGVQRCTGIGEILTPVRSAEELHLVLVKPDFSVPTAQAYKELKSDERGSSARCDRYIKALSGGSFDELCFLSDNTLELSSVRMFPAINDIKDEIVSAGAATSLMTGSGSAVFGLCENAEMAGTAADVMKKLHPEWKIIAVRTLS